jgi:hypothetical protein
MKNAGVLIATVFILLTSLASAQFDFSSRCQIVTTKGKTIGARKVKNIDSYEIKYKKFFFQIYPFKIKRNKVLYVVDKNGKKHIINDITMAENYVNFSEKAKAAPKPATDTISKAVPKNSFKPHYIERVGNKFRIDTTTIVGPGKINDLMMQSPNPMVQINLKAARTMRTFTNLSKAASFPGSAGGAFASFKTIQSLSKELKNGPASFGSYFKAGLSVLGTLSLPITSAILKKQQRKLYNKTILLYSME